MRVVLDTNVLVSALVLRSGDMVWLRRAWIAGRFTPLTDRSSAAELLRVLAYPRFELGAEEIAALLGDFLPFAETVAESEAPRGLPQCRDSQDQMFLELAARGAAELLVTGDGALLELAGEVDFAIERPAAFRSRLGLD